MYHLFLNLHLLAAVPEIVVREREVCVNFMSRDDFFSLTKIVGFKVIETEQVLIPCFVSLTKFISLTIVYISFKFCLYSEILNAVSQ